MDTHIRIYNTPDAKREGKPYEFMRVLFEDADGVFATKGKGHFIFLPWQYLSRYGYRYIDSYKEGRE